MLSYSHLFGVHDVSVSAGTEARRNEYKGVSVTGYGWVPEFGEMFSRWRQIVISVLTGIITDKFQFVHAGCFVFRDCQLLL